MADVFNPDSDDFALDDNQLAREVEVQPAVPDPSRSRVIPEEDRVMPAVVDPALYSGELPSHFFGRAVQNLPGFTNVDGGPMMMAVFNDDGDLLNRSQCEGWILNNEEGVRAVELGFVMLVEPPKAGPGSQPPRMVKSNRAVI